MKFSRDFLSSLPKNTQIVKDFSARGYKNASSINVIGNTEKLIALSFNFGKSSNVVRVFDLLNIMGTCEMVELDCNKFTVSIDDDSFGDGSNYFSIY